MLVTQDDSLKNQPGGKSHESQTSGMDASTDPVAPTVPDPPEHPTGTIAAASVSPYTGNPAVPPLEEEDSIVDFHAAFGGVTRAEWGKPIEDPLKQLDSKERANCRDELEDVIDAEQYGRSLRRSRQRR